MNGVLWYVNEDGGVYNLPSSVDQEAEYPNDFHEPFETFQAAWDKACDLDPRDDDLEEPLDDDEPDDLYWSGTGELMSDDSYIDYLNNH